MKIYQICKRVLLTIGVALGIVATGTSVNARAQQVNSNSNANNHSRMGKNVNHNQFSRSSTHLVNRLKTAPAVKSSAADTFQRPASASVSSVSTYSNASHVSTSESVPAPSSSASTNTYDENYAHYRTSAPVYFYPQTNFEIKINQLYDRIVKSSMNQVNSRRNLRPRRNTSAAARLGGFSRQSTQSSAPAASHLNTNTQPKPVKSTSNWFNDGLNRQNLRARNWISWHESNHRWNVLSYGGVCVGYFQLTPSYLGYRNGRVDLRPAHQVAVADHYVQQRYGNWMNAKRFWILHHWY